MTGGLVRRLHGGAGEPSQGTKLSISRTQGENVLSGIQAQAEIPGDSMNTGSRGKKEGKVKHYGF